VTMTVDTARPTATIVLADTALKTGETSLVTITFSEAVTGFTNADLTVANGTLSSISSSDGGLTWTAVFTPTANIEDTSNTITLDNTGISDAAGNTGTGTTVSSNYGIDTLRPTIAIGSDKAALKAGDSATLTFTLSEAAADFAQADVAVSGGALSNWTAVSSTVYTATFTPTAGSTANGVISVASTKFSDAAGNDNADGADANNSVTMTVDTVIKNTLPDAPPGSIVQLANPAFTLASDNSPVTGQSGSAASPNLGSTGTDEADAEDSSVKLFKSQGDSLHYELSLTGSIKNQLILENKEFSFRIPNGVFTHTNSSEILEFKATSPSGGPLPSWVHFDPNAKTFSGIPPVGSKSVTVLVIARDTNGREVRTSFTLGVNKEDISQNKPINGNINKPQASVDKNFNAIPGKPGFTKQVHAIGKLSRLQESRALLDSLKHL
ncbi:MAG: Ig-like domain-containing protein, partial [Methylobacter sp.]|nr:Ig-like domain-containing protein [Methylobacter sp.]